MSEHTPGPWKATGWQAQAATGCSAIDAKGFTIAGAFYMGGTEQANANARLIAAAPDLLAVAQGALGFLEDLPPHFRPDERWFAPLRDAIAKAEGDQ